MIRTPYSRGKLSTLHLTGVHDYIEQGRLYQANHDANGCSPSDNGNKTSDTPEPLNHTVCASVVETTTKPNEYSTRLSNPRASVLTISNDLICTPPNSNNNRQAISQRTTKMLVICSTTFLLLNSPYSAVLLYSIISKHVLTSTLGILRHFYFMSFCLNFFLYSLWGNRFRQEFILLLKSCCTFFVIKYKYTSKAIFQYVPTTIIDQTALNITADVNFYQSKSPCNQSFVKLQKLIINSFQHDSIHMDIKQLEKAIFQIFIETSNILQNTTQDIIFLNDYYNNSNQYRQIKTVRTNDGQFIGNSLFANYVFNKLVPPTKTTCETIININEKKLEKSTCISTTAILLTINRQISFDSKLDNQTFILTSKNLTSTQLKTTTKTDFDQLLKQICAKYELNLQYQLINMMNNELHDEDLNKILFLNTNQYSNCEWTMINQSIIDVTRYQATEYIFNNFYHDESIVEYHLDLIERKSNDHTKQILKKYFPNSCQITNIINLRMLIIISQDNLTIQCILNRNNSLKYRAIAFRFLNNEKNFLKDFQIMLNNEEESSEIRILCFQAMYSSLNISEINNLIENVKSNQLRFYIKSLFKQSSIWLANSGSYEFPFGKLNIIFDENLLFYFPNMIQLELGNNTDIDFYFVRNNEENMQWEILLIFDRKNIIRFSTIKDFFNWLNNDRLFEMKTLDEFYLKINLKSNFNLKWFTGYFNQFKNFFKKSTAGIVLKIQHGLGEIMTGYKISFNLESNFKINIHQHEYLTSYIWRSIQKENILFKIEQAIKPLVNHKQTVSKKTVLSSSVKDFCYIFPHFDSKICLSFIFERLWPSSVA
ncbi:unnamed protein product, partial [Rotaria sp. Silwood2]